MPTIQLYVICEGCVVITSGAVYAYVRSINMKCVTFAIYQGD